MLQGGGGGKQVVENLLELFPTASISPTPHPNRDSFPTYATNPINNSILSDAIAPQHLSHSTPSPPFPREGYLPHNPFKLPAFSSTKPIPTSIIVRVATEKADSAKTPPSYCYPA